MKRWIVFFSSLVLVMGLCAGSAMAAWTSGPTLQTPLIYADSSQTDGVVGSANIVYTLAAGEALTANDTITIELTGGALFTATQVTLTPSAGDLGAGVAATPPLSGGADGSTTAMWRATADIAAGSTLTINATAAIFDVSQVALNGNVDMLITLKTGTGTVIGTANKSLKAVIGNYLFTAGAADTIALTKQTDTADVSATSGAYTKFLGDTVNGTATTLSITNNSGAATLPANTAVSANKILFTLTGDFTGILQINGAGVTGSSATGSIVGGIAGQFKISTDKKTAYAVNTAALAAGGALAVAPTFVLDGSTPQGIRDFNVLVSVLDDGTNWDAHTAQSTTMLYSIIRNGVSFTANSIGALNTIKITDRSGALPTVGGLISITGYDINGNAVAPAAGATSLYVMNNATTVITGTDLQARFASVPVRYEFAVETSSAVVSNVKKTADGTTVTVYNNVNGGSI